MGREAGVRVVMPYIQFALDQTSTGDGSGKVLIAVIIIIAPWGGSWGGRNRND